MRYLLVLTSKGSSYFVSRKMDIIEVKTNLLPLTFQRDEEFDHIIYILDGELIQNPLKDKNHLYHF